MHSFHVSSAFLVTLFVACLAGCGGGDNQTTSSSSSSSSSTSSSGGFMPEAICAEQHLRSDNVIVCDKPFDAPPYVHLPPADGLTDYMVSDCNSLWDRDGQMRPSIQGPLCDGNYADEARLHAFSIYQVTLCGDSIDGPCGAGTPTNVWQFARYAVIDEMAFFAPVASTIADAKISTKKVDGSFDLAPTLPVHLTFGAPAVLMPQTDGTTSYHIDATIDNLTSGITDSAGNCMAPLSSAGTNNPFGMAKQVSLTLTRVPSMHGPGDDEAVIEFFADGQSLGTDMNPNWYFSPRDLIAPTPLVAKTYEGFGHGTPGAIPNLTVNIVKGGGMTCTP